LEADPTALAIGNTTLNGAYGNGISVPGAGCLFNYDLYEFSLKPGSANGYGLVQGASNSIAPCRRPLSLMTLIQVFRLSGEPLLATASTGDSRIITTVLQVLLNRLVLGLYLASAAAAPRIHSHLWPDQISVEEGISPNTRRLCQLRSKTQPALTPKVSHPEAMGEPLPAPLAVGYGCCLQGSSVGEIPSTAGVGFGLAKVASTHTAGGWSPLRA
jgi:gamma-glutamyltranspeptidase